MKVVKVYGALRKRLGQCRFEFDVTTPAQAIKALCVNFPGLDKWLIDSEQDGVAYRVAVSKEKATEENVAPLLMPFSDREVFSITPVVAGAGGGLGRTLLGVALIAVAIANPVVGLVAVGLLALESSLGQRQHLERLWLLQLARLASAWFSVVLQKCFRLSHHLTARLMSQCNWSRLRSLTWLIPVAKGCPCRLLMGVCLLDQLCYPAA